MPENAAINVLDAFVPAHCTHGHQVHNIISATGFIQAVAVMSVLHRHREEHTHTHIQYKESQTHRNIST